MDQRPKSSLPEDPSGIEQPHDVLAAEEFAVPTPSSRDVPPDPIHQPHDVLAAEEFAIPTSNVERGEGGGLDPRSFLPGLAIAGILLAVFKLQRRIRVR